MLLYAALDVFRVVLVWDTDTVHTTIANALAPTQSIENRSHVQNPHGNRNFV